MKSLLQSLVFMLCICPNWVDAQVLILTDQDERIAQAYLYLHQADSLQKLHKSEAAFLLVQEAACIYHSGEQWEQYGKALIKLAKLCDYVETENKEVYAQKALAIAEQHLPPSSLLEGEAYRQLTEAMLNRGTKEATESAMVYVQVAIPIFEEHEAWEDLAWSYIFLSGCHFRINELPEMEISLKAVDRIVRNYDIDKDVALVTHSYFSVLYSETGDVDKAIEWMTQAIETQLSDTIGSLPDSFFVSDCFLSLGVYYSQKGDLEKELNSLEQALLWNTSDHPVLIFYRIAATHIRKGAYRLGQSFINRSLAAYHAAEDPKAYQKERALIYDLAARSYIGTGQLDSAQLFLTQAFSLPVNHEKHVSWGVQGSLYLRKQEPQKAITALLRAIDLYDEEKATNLRHAKWYRYLGDAYLMQGKRDSALYAYQQALSAASSQAFHAENPDLTGILHPIYFLEALQSKASTLSKSELGETNLNLSFHTYQLAMDWIDSLRQAYITEESELAWGKTFKNIYAEAIDVCWRLYQDSQDKRYLQEAFQISERSKAHSLLESLSASEAARQEMFTDKDSLLAREKELKHNIVFYRQGIRQAEQNKDQNKVSLYQSYLIQNKAALTQYMTGLEEKYPAYFSLKYSNQLLSISQIQTQLLDAQTAMIEYTMGEQHSYAILISQDDYWGIDLGDNHVLQSHVQEFRKQLFTVSEFNQDPQRTLAMYHEAAYQTYLTLLDSILQPLSSEIDRLIVVADSGLTHLPFEALATARIVKSGNDFSQLPYLLQRYDIQYAYSAQLLQRNRERQAILPAHTDCLAIAPNVESNRSSINILRGTSKELQAIQIHFSGVFESGEQAHPTFFKQEASQFGLIHLAMHGKADFEDKNLAYLLFSQDINDPNPDLRLYQDELALLDLQCQLVVLSACETGIGKYVEGEGVFSLARGFMEAGSPSVLMSLWSISDQTTASLMENFYAHLAEGKSKSAAISIAKREYLQQVKLDQLHPFYWAGFVLLGDNAPLKRPQQGYAWWVAAIVCGCFGFFLLYKKAKA